MLPMVVEATRILEEQRVRDPRDVDLAAIFGLGFPAERGGPLWWADTLGAPVLVDMLEPLRPLGQRAEPTAMLTELAQSGSFFHKHPPKELR
jgi:3-hydroxyacyl-CoA dehydrogenase